MHIAIDVEGIPVPQGSFRHIGNGRIIAANPKLNAWREQIADQATRQITMAQLHQTPIQGPITVQLVFILPKPKKSAYAYPAVKDIDKLARAVLDAISLPKYIQLIGNDNQVTDLHAAKRYTLDGWTGVHIKLFW